MDLHTVSTPFTFVDPMLPIMIFWSVELLWIIPDERMKRA